MDRIFHKNPSTAHSSVDVTSPFRQCDGQHIFFCSFLEVYLSWLSLKRMSKLSKACSLVAGRGRLFTCRNIHTVLMLLHFVIHHGKQGYQVKILGSADPSCLSTQLSAPILLRLISCVYMRQCKKEQPHFAAHSDGRFDKFLN